MALTTVAIRAGIKAAVEDQVGLRAYAHFAESPSPPCVVVLFPGGITPTAFGGAWDYEMPLQLMVQRVTDERSQDRLDDLLSRLTDVFDGVTFPWGSTHITGIDGIGDLGAEQPMTVATVNLTVRA